jgi:hypothetical protein
MNPDDQNPVAPPVGGEEMAPEMPAMPAEPMEAEAPAEAPMEGEAAA